MSIELEIAEKNLFTTSQVIYTKEDLEMFFSWEARRKVVLKHDTCYWMKLNCYKIAGAVISDNSIIYPFMIPPFNDRRMMWDFLLQHLRRKTDGKFSIYGVFHEDVQVLLSFGLGITSSRRVMLRPTELLPPSVIKGFECRTIVMENDKLEIGEAITKGYKNGIDVKIFGEGCVEDNSEDTARLFDIYNIKNYSIKLIDKLTGKIAGVCLSGISDRSHNCFAEIGDICVLPAYRNRGLARYLIERTITRAFKDTSAIKLCVTVGNPAENLYRKLNFMSGDIFSNMSS